MFAKAPIKVVEIFMSDFGDKKVVLQGFHTADWKEIEIKTRQIT